MIPALRTATPADHAELSALSGQAFAVAAPTFDPATRPQLIADDRRVLAEADGRVVAHAGAWQFGQWFGGGRLACAGVAGVAVAPEHRGTGLGSVVLTRLLHLARDSGDVIASLYPMNHRFYRSLGFELSSVRSQDRIPTRELVRLRPPDGALPEQTFIRPALTCDLAGIEQLMRRRAQRGNGLLDHDARWSARYAGDRSGATYAWVALDPVGTVCGYLQVEHLAATEPGESFALAVTDLAADEVAVVARLWRLVGGDHPGARSAEAFLPDGCLPRLRCESGIVPVSRLTQMSRILDVEKALLSRGWPAGTGGEVLLRITDPMFAGNSGPLRLAVRDGVADLDRNPPPAGRRGIEVGIATLSSLLTGYLDPATAAWSGLLPGATDADVAALRLLFSGPSPQTVEYF